MSRLQVHLPISPTPSFFTMVEYFSAGLRQYGGGFADARIIVSVGDDCEPYDIASDQPQLARYDITWRWVDRLAFRRQSYIATGLDRWAEPFDSEYVLMADADIFCLGDFSDLAAQLPHPRGIAGVIATFPPWLGRDKGDIDRVEWTSMFALAGLPPPVFDCPHPGYGVYYPAGCGMEFGPPYYNFGFVLGTREAMNAIAATIRGDCELTDNYMQTDLSDQAGLAVSIVRNKVGYLALPMRYNFWSDERFYNAYASEAADVRILHYLMGPFRKHHDNGSIADVEAWIVAHRDDPGPHAQFIVECVRRSHAAVLAQRALQPTCMPRHAPERARRHHLLIAGTGRSGTTFLVRYLTALGLDTHLTRDRNAALDEAAQAGLEDYPTDADFADLPYVVKNPALYEFIDQLLAHDDIAIDTVIIPVRSLREAAASRVILERRARYETQPFLAFMDKVWDSGGGAPGGIVYSINAVDQARMLATGFHLLIERLVQANVPIVFLDFPRMIHDADYLFAKLAALHPHLADEGAALAAHAKVADGRMIRTELETGPVSATDALNEDLDRAALRRELVRLRSAHERTVAAISHELTAAHEQERETRGASADERSRSEALLAEARSNHRLEVERSATAQRALEAEKSAVAHKSAELHVFKAELVALQNEVRAMRASNSWRLTHPLRVAAIKLRARLNRPGT